MQALSGITGRKGRLGGLVSHLKSRGLTVEGLVILSDLGVGEESGTHRVAVECVDTVRYPDGEGNSLAYYRR